MKRFLFLVSHLGSGHLELSKSLDSHNRLQIYHLNTIYNHPTDLEAITSKRHKMDNSSAIYGDQLLFNYSFCCPELYKSCKFVYLVREAGPSLDWLANYRYAPEQAYMYYTFRLRRMCEMAKKSGGILLTWDSMSSGLKVLEETLCLKSPVPSPDKPVKSEEIFIPELKIKAQETYEKYLYHMKRALVFK